MVPEGSRKFAGGASHRTSCSGIFSPGWGGGRLEGAETKPSLRSPCRGPGSFHFRVRWFAPPANFPSPCRGKNDPANPYPHWNLSAHGSTNTDPKNLLAHGPESSLPIYSSAPSVPLRLKKSSSSMSVRGINFDFGKEPAEIFIREPHSDLRDDRTHGQEVTRRRPTRRMFRHSSKPDDGISLRAVASVRGYNIFKISGTSSSVSINVPLGGRLKAFASPIWLPLPVKSDWATWIAIPLVTVVI